MIEEKKEQKYICDFCVKVIESPDLPSNWSEYKVECYSYSMTSGQRFPIKRHLCNECESIVQSQTIYFKKS